MQLRISRDQVLRSLPGQNESVKVLDVKVVLPRLFAMRAGVGTQPP